MSRYIDADLLKAEFAGNFDDAYEIALIKAIIDMQPEVGKWIPCSFAYPPVSQDEYDTYWSEPVQVTYLSYYEKKPMCGVAAVYCKTSNTWYWWDGEVGEDEVKVEIVAWQPLPESYQFADIDKVIEMEGEKMMDKQTIVNLCGDVLRRENEKYERECAKHDKKHEGYNLGAIDMRNAIINALEGEQE